MDTLLAVAGDSLALRLVLIVLVALVVHGLVLLVRRTSLALQTGGRVRHRKARTVTTLVTSTLVFLLYFFAVGLALREVGVDLKVYLASASVIGLAVGFGSQGVVQDVVTGLTLVFSDLIDVDDLVEVSGQVGKVRAITMRFVELENAMGARVFIPNRTVANVINYPKGYVRLLADVTLTGDEDRRQAMQQEAQRLMETVHEQYPNLLLTAPSMEGRVDTRHGKAFVRLKFRIWPNRGQPIELAVQKELVSRLKTLDPDYQDWMVTVTYEVEARAQRR